MTEEEKQYQLEWSDPNEFGTVYAKELLIELKNLKNKYNKALQLLTEYNLPCEIDSFNAKDENLEYCSKNCSVDEEIFIKCWDRFIEQELENDK